jgi:hypothetical protein
VSRDSYRYQPLPRVWESSNAVSPLHDCFADEVAIDFPSAGHFVERVRDGFLGEPGGREILTTEVWLSRREASAGTIVPLEVPLRGTCAGCGGRGEIWTEPCGDCRGTGDSLVHHPVRLSVPAGVADGARFRFRVRAPHAEVVRVEVRVAIRSSAA